MQESAEILLKSRLGWQEDSKVSVTRDRMGLLRKKKTCSSSLLELCIDYNNKKFTELIFYKCFNASSHSSSSLYSPPLHDLETPKLLYHHCLISCPQRPQKFLPPPQSLCLFPSFPLYAREVLRKGVSINMAFYIFSFPLRNITCSFWHGFHTKWGHWQVSLMIFPLLHFCGGLKTIALPSRPHHS